MWLPLEQNKAHLPHPHSGLVPHVTVAQGVGQALQLSVSGIELLWNVWNKSLAILHVSGYRRFGQMTQKQTLYTGCSRVLVLVERCL